MAMAYRAFMQRLKILVLFIVASLTGCATLSSMTTVVRLAYDGDPQPLDKVAVIIGDGRIVFRTIDGQSPSHYRKLAGNALAAIGGSLEVDVLPGPHDFELCYEYKETVGVNSMGQPVYNTYRCADTVRASLVAEAGKIYQVKQKDAGRWPWSAQVQDVTEKYQARLREEREKIMEKVNARQARRAKPDS
jgi:hypothetical protein